MFNSLDELKAAVEDRRQSVLTLEVDLGAKFSQEHEDAKAALQQARALKQVIGNGNGFLADNEDELEQRVADTRPEGSPVWVQYRKIGLDEWAQLVKQTSAGPVDQYEKVLAQTFIGVFGSDPVRPEDLPEGEAWEAPEPLTTEARYLSSRGPDGILPGGSLTSVVSAFMAWQNSGGEVSIRPTKSGRD